MTTILLILFVPLAAVVVAGWAWRFHLRALQLVGPGLAAVAGGPAASTAEVVSVLVDHDTALVGLRAARAVAPRTPRTTVRELESTLVLSIAGHGDPAVARLRRWEASGASVLVWREGLGDEVEFCQLHTGHHVRLPMSNASPDGIK